MPMPYLVNQPHAVSPGQHYIFLGIGAGAMILKIIGKLPVVSSFKIVPMGSYCHTGSFLGDIHAVV